MSRIHDIGPRELGEIDRPFTYYFVESDNATPTALTGYSSAWVDYENPAGVEASGIAAIIDAAGGAVQFPWVAAMTDTVGTYKALVWVTDGTRKFSSQLLEWSVVNGPGPSN